MKISKTRVLVSLLVLSLLANVFMAGNICGEWMRAQEDSKYPRFMPLYRQNIYELAESFSPESREKFITVMKKLREGGSRSQMTEMMEGLREILTAETFDREKFRAHLEKSRLQRKERMEAFMSAIEELASTMSVRDREALVQHMPFMNYPYHHGSKR